MADNNPKPKPHQSSDTDGSARSPAANDAEAVKRNILFGTPIPQPKADTRFKKGQSGNPKGRPKRESTPPTLAQQPTKTMVLAEGDRLLTVRENGQPVKMSARQVVLRSQESAALKGNAYAQEKYLVRAERLEHERALEIERENEKYIAYQMDCWLEMARAKAEGKPEPEFVPHPDDIVIRPGQPVAFLGPRNAFEASCTKSSIQWRKALLMQAAMDVRLHVPTPGEDGKLYLSSAYLFALKMNATLPPRLRWEEPWMFYQFDRWTRTSLRTLLKEVRAEWQTLGQKFPRGKTFPDLEHGIRNLKMITSAVERALQQAG